MGMSREEMRAVFDRAVAATRERSPATFDQWFGGVQFDDLTDTVLTLRAQNEFVLDWVKTNFLPDLVDQIRRESGRAVQVAWIIDPNLDQPVSQAAIAEPVRPRPLTVHGSDPPTTTGPAFKRRSRPPDDINPRFTFSNFVVGPSNQLAHAAAVAAAGGGGRRYNPLFLCGGTGLGKTHLVHATALRICEERHDARIRYVSAERFTNEFITALQHQRMDDFRTRYREECDLLLVDDIQFLAGRVQTQEEFFHTFNALHNADRQIVVTSDKYPQALERMEERLISRFASGLVADIQSPELETRVAIVRNKAALEGIELDDQVAVYLAQAIRSNVRELEGTLIRLAAKSSLTGQSVDMEFVQAELKNVVSQRTQTVSVEDIQR
ncbi:MAG: chromosomal replication initiator protein DnaA, partial [Deltaproteobacteria bacterium]|nr:chromosomal replication initiator protein DnaA [Deltaproteobacteria bacterium]MBW2536389.1 chromosomal replication initiator protein DnaA [Deltaproteobacteria bacterium]